MDKIPNEVQFVLKELEKHGFEAYIVGGCVRDLILKRTPNDWDVATNAKPDEVQKIFPDSLYENRFGTVTARISICHPEEQSGDRVPPKLSATEQGTRLPSDSLNRAEKPQIQEIQTTTYRIEQGYSDRRHPDKIEFAKTLEEDLSRRDFTINALAVATSQKSKVKSQKSHGFMDFRFYGFSASVVDLYGGQDDIKNKLIRAVGNPIERFDEDALRMMRAARFAVQLGFEIEEKTANAIRQNAHWLERISKERIRDELVKIIMSDNPSEGVELLRELGLLRFIIPELEYGIGVTQNLHHIYTVYQHLILSLKNCPSKKLSVRLAALLHDIAKPKTKQGSGVSCTFYNHDYLGARFTKSILKRLKFSNEIIEKTSALVGSHMFFYNVDEVSEAGVRRLVKKIGRENVKDLIDLRIADRLGSGVPKAKPYKLRHLEYMIEKVSKDPISVKMLKINGEDIMKILGIAPGVKIGAILDCLLSEVLDDPTLNNRAYLEKRVKEISKLNLNQLRDLAKEKIEERKEEEDKVIKRKYWVK